MNYRIHEIEEVISEMNLLKVEDNIAEMDENMQLVISGWYVHIPEINQSEVKKKGKIALNNVRVYFEKKNPLSLQEK